MKRIFFKANAGSSPATAFKAAGLKLTAHCATGPQLIVKATSSKDSASIHANEQPALMSSGTYVENDDMTAGAAGAVPILGPDGMEDVPLTSGQIIYSKPSGKAVTIDFIAGQGVGTPTTCVFAGAAEVASGSAVVNYRANPGTASEVFFHHGGLALSGSCGAGEDLNVVAHSHTKHAIIHVNDQYLTNGFDYLENNDFSPGSPFTIVSHGDSLAGQVIYSRPNGKTTTIEDLAEEDIFGKSKCGFIGTNDYATTKTSNSVDFRVDAPTPQRTVFKRDHVEVDASCDAGPALTASLAASDPSLEVQGANAQYAPDQSTFSGSAGSSGSGDFTFGYGGSHASGQLIVARAGNKSVVAIDYLAETSDAYGGRKDCALVGTSRVLTP
jgi:hypothetical protein